MQFIALPNLADKGHMSQNNLSRVTAEAVDEAFVAGRMCARVMLDEDFLFRTYLSLKGRNETVDGDAGLPAAGDAA